MPRPLPVLLLLALACAGLAAEPDFAGLPTEELTLADGRRLVGRYDETRGLLWLVGPANARIGLRPGDIARRRELAPGERPGLPDAPLPARTTRGDGAATVSPAIVLAAKRDEVAALRHRKRDLARLVGEQDRRRQHFEQVLKQLKDRYREQREQLDWNPDPDFGIESQRSFRLRELHGDVLRCVQALRQSEERLAALTASRADAFLALSRGQAELAALERGDDAVAVAPAAPPAPEPVEPALRRIRELETRLDGLQREHDRLRRAYEALRARPAAPPAGEGVQPHDEGRTAAGDDARLALAPGG